MITFTKYNAIRILLRGGASVEEICQTFGVTEHTVLLVKKCDSYEQYKSECNTLKYLAKKQKEAKRQEQEKQKTPSVQVVEHLQTVKIEATHYMMEELRTMNQTLKLISNKMAFIVEELTGTEKGSDT